jgi:hypothetical protein
MARIGIMQVVAAALVAFAGMDAMAEVKDGTTFHLGTVPEKRNGDRPHRFLITHGFAQP